ncbi:MAG TPA: aspartate aminotransferase family protein [Alphaproteobacteria bacterium]
MATSAVMPSYARADIAFERGAGVYLYATDGRRYLDFGSGVAVNALGHCHPHLVAALEAQGRKLWHASNLYRIPGQERMAERLVAHSFADTVFFCNSGAEAVETGIKIVRKYHDHTGNPDRYRIIAFEGSFHGRTLTTISAGANAMHRKGFEPLMDGFDHVAFGNMNEVRAAIGPQTAAILVEPVQGEGGVRPATEQFLRELRTACDEHGLLLFFDEVQTGMGRTGKLFAYEWAGIAPDVMAVAKGIGGGFPIGACLATEKAAAGITAGTHGSTFGGNPLAMAVGNAVLDVMLADGFMAGVQRVSAYLERKLAGLPARHPKLIAEVRGRGLLQGIKCVGSNYDLNARLLKNGLLTVPAGDNVVRLLPPLIVTDQEIDAAIDILDRTCREMTA